MTKRIFILMMVCLGLLMVTSCSDDDDKNELIQNQLLGNWKVEGLKEVIDNNRPDGMPESIEIGDISVEFAKDGNLKVMLNGVMPLSGTYVQKDKRVTINMDVRSPIIIEPHQFYFDIILIENNKMDIKLFLNFGGSDRGIPATLVKK